MNTPHPQHHLPADTPSGCFADLFHCLLCGGTVSTRSPISSPPPHSNHASTTLVDLLRNDDLRRQVQLPIVARLMGLETPVDTSWAPRKLRVDDSFNRSRSVNSVDCSFHFSREPALLHRRVRSSMSFREVPVGDFLVVCLEKSKRGKDEAKTEHRKDERGSVRESKRHITAGIESSGGRIVTKMGASGQRKENNRCTARNLRSSWQQKNDYYRKPQLRNKAPEKEASKWKPKPPKNGNSSNFVCPETSVSDRWCPSGTQSRTRKARSASFKVSPRPRTEERRSRRKSKIEDEMMMKKKKKMKMKMVVEQDLGMKRWKWKNEGVFVYKDYSSLSVEMELGILDELVNQMVHDLASKM